MKNKKHELLELQYDRAKSWLFSVLSILIALSVSLPNADKSVKLILALLLLLAVLCFAIFFIIYNISHANLRKYILSKPDRI